MTTNLYEVSGFAPATPEVLGNAVIIGWHLLHGHLEQRGLQEPLLECLGQRGHNLVRDQVPGVIQEFILILREEIFFEIT